MESIKTKRLNKDIIYYGTGIYGEHKFSAIVKGPAYAYRVPYSVYGTKTEAIKEANVFYKCYEVI